MCYLIAWVLLDNSLSGLLESLPFISIASSLDIQRQQDPATCLEFLFHSHSNGNYLSKKYRVWVFTCNYIPWQGNSKAHMHIIVQYFDYDFNILDSIVWKVTRVRKDLMPETTIP